MQTPAAIWVLNGPNLNRLGRREPAIYGTTTLAEIVAGLERQAAARGATLVAHQSNHEGELIDWLHAAEDAGAGAVLMNAGGYTHTSVALRDAVASIAVPVWEVHLSDPAAREPFRRVNFLRDVCHGHVAGLGAASYARALDEALAHVLEARASRKGME